MIPVSQSRVVTRLTSPFNQLRLLALVGLLAPVWLNWSLGRLTYAIYVAKGAPSRPSLGLLWTSVYAPSLVLGLLAGVAASVLSKESPIKGWVIFSVSLLVGAAVQSVLTGVALLECLGAFLGSVGNLLFWVGTLLWPGIVLLRRHAGGSGVR
jgi:hypothetical protein